MMGSLARFVSVVFRSPRTKAATVKTMEHVFRKFPASHANKTVRAAFKVGVAIGKKTTVSKLARLFRFLR